jgi:hypothetical protein
MLACGKGAITRLTFATIFCTQNSQRNQGQNFAAKGLIFAQNHKTLEIYNRVIFWELPKGSRKGLA